VSIVPTTDSSPRGSTSWRALPHLLRSEMAVAEVRATHQGHDAALLDALLEMPRTEDIEEIPVLRALLQGLRQGAAHG
jgi:hypothetical protein